MQHIENLRRENEVMRKQVSDEQTRWQERETTRRAEVEAESERLRKEASESRQRLEEPQYAEGCKSARPRYVLGRTLVR